MSERRFDLVAANLLGRHIGELAADRSLGGHAGNAADLGDAEVEHLEHTVEGGQQVRRRHVAVDQVEALAAGVGQLMGVMQPFTRLLTQAGDHPHVIGVDRLLAVAGDARHRHALQIGHGDEILIADLAQLVDVADVGVRQLPGNARLVEEHRAELFGRHQLRQQPLDHHQLGKAALPVQPREEDLAHPAGGELGEQPVAPEELLTGGRGGGDRHWLDCCISCAGGLLDRRASGPIVGVVQQVCANDPTVGAGELRGIASGGSWHAT